MSDFDLVIRRARCATAADIFDADIGIIDNCIAALGKNLGPGKKEIDAAGRWVLPGGIDGHCHLDQATTDGSEMADDFLTGPLSAACGGTTTILSFACQLKGQSLRAAVDDYHQRAEGKPCIDYAFHMIITDATPDVLNRELPELIREGYTSFKIYMTYDDLKLADREIIEVLAVARDHGAMVMVHAENHDCIAWLTDRLLAAGKTAPKYHGEAHAMLAEREATHRAISYAELVDVPILIVHVSGREAVEQIRWAHAHGLRIYAETCPQYLFLTADDLGIEDDQQGAKCVCSPPPRDKANQEIIWSGLENNAFQIFSSDHAPYNMTGSQGKFTAGEDASFNKIPNGIPGLETRLALLFSHGVETGRLTIQQFVALTATNVAKMYGLYPRKGSIAIGADADLVIWETGIKRSIRNVDLHHAVDYTPYEGIEVSAWPAVTLSRGNIVWQDGQYLGQPGQGQFLFRDLPIPARPKPRPDGKIEWTV